nr:uncharacterized protein LOC108946684 [Nicotiana tomentosiformis]
MGYKSATTHALLNCLEVVPFLNHFVGQFGHDAVYTRFDTWFKQFMAGKGQGNNDPNSTRGREKTRKGKRRVDNNTPSFSPSSEMLISYPPPHGYTELPQHHKAYTFIQILGLPSQGHRTIRPTYNPATSQPRGSQGSAS